MATLTIKESITATAAHIEEQTLGGAVLVKTSTTITFNNDCTLVLIAIGGGGGGGKSTTVNPGDGGGGGEICRNIVSFKTGDSLNVVIGAEGAAGSANDGGNGGDTSIILTRTGASIISATGGSGGWCWSSGEHGTTPYSRTTTGGTNGKTSIDAEFQEYAQSTPGGNGGDKTTSNGRVSGFGSYGGGGGRGGVSLVDNNGTGIYGGGNGGTFSSGCSTNTCEGKPGTANSGGGGGGGAVNSSGKNGGAGGSGAVIFMNTPTQYIGISNIETKLRELHQLPGSQIDQLNQQYNGTMMAGAMWTVLATSLVYYVFTQL